MVYYRCVLCVAFSVLTSLPVDRQPLSVAIQQTVNALSIGAIYALIALGYTMVYGIIELINFAHGDVFMVGAFLSPSSSSAGSWARPAPCPERSRS